MVLQSLPHFGCQVNLRSWSGSNLQHSWEWCDHMRGADDAERSKVERCWIHSMMLRGPARCWDLPLQAPGEEGFDAWLAAALPKLQNEKAGWCRPTWAWVWRSCPDHSPNINQYQIYHISARISKFSNNILHISKCLEATHFFPNVAGQWAGRFWRLHCRGHWTCHWCLTCLAPQHCPQIFTWKQHNGAITGSYWLLMLVVYQHIHIQYIYIYKMIVCVYLSIVAVCQVKICSWSCVRHSSAMLIWELRAATKDWWCVGGHPLQWEGRPDPHVADLMGLPRP